MNLSEMHLWERLHWAKQNLEKYNTEYVVVYEDNIDRPAKVVSPDPNWMACALHGGILPPVWVYHELAKDEAQPGFVNHTRGYLLHETEPMGPMSEEEAIEYLVMKDVPQHVWKTWNDGNKPKMVICKQKQLPSTREWRNAWRISEELNVA